MRKLDNILDKIRMKNELKTWEKIKPDEYDIWIDCFVNVKECNKRGMVSSRIPIKIVITDEDLYDNINNYFEVRRLLIELILRSIKKQIKRIYRKEGYL